MRSDLISRDLTYIMIAAVFDPCLPGQDVEDTAARHQQDAHFDVMQGMNVRHRSPSVPSDHAGNSAAPDVTQVRH